MKRAVGLVALGLALLGAGCAHTTTALSVKASAALVEQPAWHRLSAEHRVVVSVSLPDGTTDTRTLRGLIAIERPDRFRLRALGPAGISLFDLLVKDGKTVVVSAIRTPADGKAGQTLADITTSLAADLACAYALSPSGQRTVRVEGDDVIVAEPGRSVRLSRFSGPVPTWHRADIAAATYTVRVDVTQVEVDPVLDPALWRE